LVIPTERRTDRIQAGGSPGNLIWLGIGEVSCASAATGQATRSL
jgi:hypothetical protein